jgi:2-dehydro-3-deoxyphosphogluconate aldolase/(4S)-4-hydroxy-2-oxoglutarate aldolase
MSESFVRDRIADTGIIAQTNIACAEDAAEVAKSILTGGVGAMTVSILEKDAEKIIFTIAQECPGMLIGASDITETEQCKTVTKAGAAFVTSPGLDADMAAWCGENDVLLIPNCVTPAEMLSARKLGLRLLGFFPADSYGGIATLESASEILRDVKWIPFAIKSLESLDDFASKGCVAAVGCGWLYRKGDTISGTAERCRDAVDRMLGFELFHLGINSADSKAALATAERLHDAFGFKIAEGPGAYYVSTGLKKLTEDLIDPTGKIAGTEPGAFYVTTDFEVMKKNYLGTNGHLAIRTNSIERAMVYLKKKGYSVDMGTAYRKGDRYFTVYLGDGCEFGGFAVHLFQK